MPLLTPYPRPASPAACEKWAAVQDEDAIYMWGTQEDGGSFKAVALQRLVASCLGHRAPEIVGFGSSVGFDDAYCEKHPKIKLCRNYNK
jgi:hypothetical protein